MLLSSLTQHPFTLRHHPGYPVHSLENVMPITCRYACVDECERVQRRYAQRFVRTIKESGLERMILFWGKVLAERHIREFTPQLSRRAQ